MNIKLLAGTLVVPLAVLALSACGEQPAQVSDSGDSSVVTDAPAEENTGSEDEADADAEEVEQAPATATLGDTVELGGWSVTVTEVATNANAVIAKANPFNDKPKGQYVLVTYDAVYNGDERTADAAMDLTWTLTTNDNKIHDMAYEVTPADDQEWPTEVRPGGTVKGQVLFDVQPAALTGSILSVETWDDNLDTIYADFLLS